MSRKYKAIGRLDMHRNSDNPIIAAFINFASSRNSKAAVNSTKSSCDTLPHLSIGPRVVVAVALQQIDDAPHTEARAESDHKGLQSRDRRSKESHKSYLQK